MAPRTKTTKPKTEPKPRGRPSSYTPEIGARICEEIAQGAALYRLCQQPDMPSERAVYQWLEANPDFTQEYARARERQQDRCVDEIIEIADIEEDPQRARVRIDARKWRASKLAPKKYGDKVDLSHGIQPGDPLLDLLKGVQGTAFKPVAVIQPDDDSELDEGNG